MVKSGTLLRTRDRLSRAGFCTKIGKQHDLWHTREVGSLFITEMRLGSGANKGGHVITYRLDDKPPYILVNFAEAK